jgi:catechol 2,3-dioxygenase-like lactoylglutathione lyase family enzyme
MEYTGTSGIHHITAIASDAQRTLDFYAGALGMRLVKKTVNFDAPETYHFYLGDTRGHPGTLMTFFIWPRPKPGRVGTGQITVVSFSIPETAVEFWVGRLKDYRIPVEGPLVRFGQERLGFRDPDGLFLELVASGQAQGVEPWPGPVSREHAVGGIHGVTLLERSTKPTADLLSKDLGLRRIQDEEGMERYAAPGKGPGLFVDIRSAPGSPPGVIGCGSVHHMAFRAADDTWQMTVRNRLVERGFQTTPQIDRKYFKSIYFHEPGGVLFEVATDPPGFTVDERLEALGSGLMLPEKYEPYRERLEQVLSPVHPPETPR